MPQSKPEPAMESTFPPLPPHPEAQTLEITPPKSQFQPSKNTSQPPDDMETDAAASPVSERPEPSDISTNDPPSSLLAPSSPLIERPAGNEHEYISDSDSDSDYVDLHIDGEDGFHEPFNMSVMSVASTELVDDLGEGRLMPLLIEAYDLVFPDQLRRGIADGTISLGLSTDSSYEDDDDASYISELELGERVLRGDAEPSAYERKGFIDSIFTWMKRVPDTDESELAVSLSENLSEKAVGCDLKRKPGISDLHLAYETSDEGPNV